MLSQLVVKAFSYVSSSIVLKHCCTGELVTVSIRLKFYFDPLLFFGRYALKDRGSFICMLVNALIRGITSLFYHLYFGAKALEMQQLGCAFALYSIATFVELLVDAFRVMESMGKFNVETIRFVMRHLSLNLWIVPMG